MKAQRRWFCIYFLLLASVTNEASDDSTNAWNITNGGHGSTLANDARNQTRESRCNSTCETSTVKIQFATTIVKNEYIVAFTGYYKPHARENYIGAALNSCGVDNWKILSRDNPASGFPSDFDVVLLEETHKRNGLDALSDHPLVRRVTPQRVVYRSLKYINSSEENDTPEYKNFKRKINSYVRAFISSTSASTILGEQSYLCCALYCRTINSGNPQIVMHRGGCCALFRDKSRVYCRLMLCGAWELPDAALRCVWLIR